MNFHEWEKEIRNTAPNTFESCLEFVEQSEDFLMGLYLSGLIPKAAVNYISEKLFDILAGDKCAELGLYEETTKIP